MAKLVMMCGVPGSGKSYFSGTLKKRARKHVYIISSDGLRKTVLGSVQNFTNEKLIWTLFYDLAKTYSIDKEGIVVLDATQLTVEYRTETTRELKDLFDQRFLLVFEINKELVFKQNKNRKYPVPPEELERMIGLFEEPGEQDREYFTDILYVRNHDIMPIIKKILKK